MQIHELPQHSGTPANGSNFAIDTGTNTFKLPFSALGEAVITAFTTTINGAAQTVKAAIEALAVRLTTAESDITDISTQKSASFSFFGVNTNVYRMGKIVLVQFFGTPQVELTARTEVTVGTLPTGFRPAFRVASKVFTSDAGGPRIQIVFNTNGNIAVYNHETTTHEAGRGFIRDFWVFFAA